MVVQRSTVSVQLDDDNCCEATLRLNVLTSRHKPFRTRADSRGSLVTLDPMGDRRDPYGSESPCLDEHLYEQLPAEEPQTKHVAFTLQGPSQSVLSKICAPGQAAGSRLLSLFEDLASTLEQGMDDFMGGSKVSTKLRQRLDDLHALVVELDDNLQEKHMCDQGARSDALADCMQWLSEVQRATMWLQQRLCQKDLPDNFQMAPDSRELSDIVVVLQQIVAQMTYHNAEGLNSTRPSKLIVPASRRLARKVASAASLPYNTHWARKVAI